MYCKYPSTIAAYPELAILLRQYPTLLGHVAARRPEDGGGGLLSCDDPNVRSLSDSRYASPVDFRQIAIGRGGNGDHRCAPARQADPSNLAPKIEIEKRTQLGRPRLEDAAIGIMQRSKRSGQRLIDIGVGIIGRIVAREDVAFPHPRFDIYPRRMTRLDNARFQSGITENAGQNRCHWRGVGRRVRTRCDQLAEDRQQEDCDQADASGARESHAARRICR